MDNEKTVTTRTMELIVAALFMVAAAVVILDNYRIGAGWTTEGPQAGYFPFYIGVIMFVSSAATFVIALVGETRNLSNFVERSQLRLVLQVLVPTIGFVVLTNFLGIYVSAALFICFFMCWLGKYPIYKAAPIAVAVPVILFFMFEIWFLVPLPKGPFEAAIGY